MGQHADDIINGDVDQHTGEWLGNGQGYPRNSNRSYSRNLDKSYSGGAKVRGIQKWLKKRGIEPTNELLEKFLIEKQPHLNLNRYGDFRNKAIHISGCCFELFNQWIVKNY